jgi:hypothetical protein
MTPQELQEEKIKQLESQFAQVINRRVIERRINIVDYISSEQFSKLKDLLKKVFVQKAAHTFSISNGDYLELFYALFGKIEYENLSINIYQLGTMCKMINTSCIFDEMVIDEEDITELLMLRVEMDVFDKLFSSEVSLIEKAARREIKSNEEINRQTPKSN